jgi:hypothetical protein
MLGLDRLCNAIRRECWNLFAQYRFRSRQPDVSLKSQANHRGRGGGNRILTKVNKDSWLKYRLTNKRKDCLGNSNVKKDL